MLPNNLTFQRKQSFSLIYFLLLSVNSLKKIYYLLSFLNNTSCGSTYYIFVKAAFLKQADSFQIYINIFRPRYFFAYMQIWEERSASWKWGSNIYLHLPKQCWERKKREYIGCFLFYMEFSVCMKKKLGEKMNKKNRK